MFSCCCARVDFSWSPVCDCYAGGYKCEQTCLEDALITESVYATVGTVSQRYSSYAYKLTGSQDLYNNVTYMFPNANIWLIGHSVSPISMREPQADASQLGGSVGAMIGLSFGAPAVTIESPGDRLPAGRLHLPLPPGMPAEKTGITHVYHTADPIPMGACTGTYSGCYAAGFVSTASSIETQLTIAQAMESACHTGQTILYDTVTVKGWSVDVRTHRIGEIINKVLADPWPTEGGGDGGNKTVNGHSGWWHPWRSAAKGDQLTASRFTWWGWGRKGPKGGEGDPDDDDGDEWNKHGGVPAACPESGCTDCYRW